MSTTKDDWRDPAILCRERGWTVGTRLAGTDLSGETVIEITAIGESQVLAKTLKTGREASWTLACRDWQPVGKRTSP